MTKKCICAALTEPECDCGAVDYGEREWVGLDFDTIEECFGDGGGTDDYGQIVLPSAQWLHDFAHAIEAKLKEKNT